MTLVRVLITNDDGIDSHGIHALATVADALGLDVASSMLPPGQQRRVGIRPSIPRAAGVCRRWTCG